MQNNIVIQWLDNAIEWLEQAITRLAIVCLIIGFVMGTISILTPKFQLSDLSWYDLLWAIVQAVSFDTLFVAVLFLVRDSFKAENRPKWYVFVWYIGVAVLLGIVASVVSTTLAYQELSQTKTIVDAMANLGISQEAFAYTRSILAVLVTALVCTLPRKKVTPVSYKDRLLNKYRRENDKLEAKLIAQKERETIIQQFTTDENNTVTLQPVKMSALFGLIKIYDTTVQQPINQTLIEENIQKISVSVLDLKQEVSGLLTSGKIEDNTIEAIVESDKQTDKVQIVPSRRSAFSDVLSD